MVVERRPPKMMAEIGTPLGFSQSGSMVGHWLAGAVKRPLGWAAGVVEAGVQGLPRQSRQWSGGVSVMPSHQTPPSGVRATLVKMVLRASVAMALGLVLADVPGATPKKPASGLMARSWPVASGLIQAMSSPTVQIFQPLKPLGRDHHGEVGLAASRGERRRHVGHLALGRLDAEDEHVFGHPAFIAGDVGGDAEGEAFFAEQRVAAVAGAVTPDFAGFGKVDDVLGVVAGPGDVLLVGCERSAYGMHARDDTLEVLVDFAEDGSADAGHDAHVDDGIGGVGELDADLRHRRANGAHREREDIHGAAAHAAFEEGFQLFAHDERVFPVVGGAGVVLGERADEGTVFDAGHVVGSGTGVEAAGPLFVVKGEEGAGFDELGAEAVVLGLGAIDPVDGRGLGEVGHFFDPADEVLVGGERLGLSAGRGFGQRSLLGYWSEIKIDTVG